MRRHIINLLLLFAIGALAAWVWNQRAGDAPTQTPLLPLSEAEISTTGFDLLGNDVRVMLQKSDAGWTLQEPVTAPADPSEVASLLSVARAPVSEQFPAAEVALSDLGLDRPERVLAFNDHRVALGAIHPVTRERYVLIDDSTVALIPDPAGAPQNIHHSNFIAKTLVPPSLRLARVTLPDHELVASESGWGLDATGDGTTEVTSDSAERAGAAWSELRAMWTSQWAEDSVVPEDAEIVTLHFDDGSSALLHAHRAQQLELIRPDWQVRYHVARDKSDLLLDLAVDDD